MTVDESVFDKIENGASKKIFEESHIDSNLPPDQKESVEALLKKHIDVFSKYDSDIGDCDMIRHRIDLVDDTPCKQKHRCIPPAMIDEVRKHIEELLSSGVIRITMGFKCCTCEKEEWKTKIIRKLTDA